MEGYDIPDLVVCGGSALQIIGLLDRATKDVDVIALLHIDINGNKVLETSDPLPNAVISAASQVARALALSPDWLNSGPADLIRDLPVGFIDRLHSMRFGSRMVVHFIDRYDQIMFKTYAALNGGDIRHLTDLKALSPTAAEILEAAHWCLRQDSSEVFPKIVRSFLEETGYGNIIKQLDESNQE